MKNSKRNDKIQDVFNEFVRDIKGLVYSFETDNVIVRTTDVYLYYELLRYEREKILSFYESTGMIKNLDELLVRTKNSEFLVNAEVSERWENALFVEQETFITEDEKILGGTQTLILADCKEDVVQYLPYIIEDHARELEMNLDKQYETIDVPHLKIVKVVGGQEQNRKSDDMLDTTTKIIDFYNGVKSNNDKIGQAETDRKV